MNTVESGGKESAAPSERVASVDAFRGLTILVMVFVNDLGSGAPAWMHHLLPGHADGMTLADVVFPKFLFIVGMAVALAFERASLAGRSWGRRVGHIMLRTACLLCMGVIEINAGYDRAFPPHIWHLLTFAALILAFCDPPQERGLRRNTLIGLKSLGIAGLVALLATFRRQAAPAEILLWGGVENWGWLRSGFWGVLGQIGWAYFTVAMLTLMLGRRREWLMGSVATLLLLHLALQPSLPQGVEARKRRFDLDFPQRFAADVQPDTPRGKLFARLDEKPWLAGIVPALAAIADGVNELGRYVNVADATGSLAALTMAGCLLGTILRRDSDIRTHGARVRWTTTFLVGLFLAGAIADKFEGINEDAATVTFCLWTAAIAAAVWLALYLVVDAAGFQRWAAPLRLAGENPLVAYLLHPMIIWAIRLAGMESSLLAYRKAGEPWVIAGSLAMAAFVCIVSGLLGRVGLRMRL